MSSRADKKSAAAPLLRLRSRFHPLMQLYRHPVRLTVSLLLMLFLLPEAAMLGTKFAGLPVFVSYVFSCVAVFCVVLLPQFCVAFVNCRAVAYEFHADHLSFIENAMLRDKIRVPYRSVSAVHVRQNPLQRRLRLADIVIETKPVGFEGMAGSETVIDDIRAARRVREKIETLVAAYHAGAQTPAP
ncbi:MAG TPA: PH domain-containing protein [Alphaproteobacteria bacterium]|nr:PH domain-containing protein [Alphaproteobacteria bacterium]